MPSCSGCMVFFFPAIGMYMNCMLRVVCFTQFLFCFSLQVLRCLFRHDARLCKQHTDDWWWHSHRWCESCPNKNSQQSGEKVKDNQGSLNLGSLFLLFLFAPTKICGVFVSLQPFQFADTAPKSVGILLVFACTSVRLTMIAWMCACYPLQ